MNRVPEIKRSIYSTTALLEVLVLAMVNLFFKFEVSSFSRSNIYKMW